jgi:hypothetical protein
MTGAAVMTASWGRATWKRGTGLGYAPAPAMGGTAYTGDANGGPIGLTVEIFLGQLGWTDISAYCRYAGRVKIQRGLPDETTSMTAQSCALTLNNFNGQFCPRNANGPWYGLIQRNTPIRVSRWQNGNRRFRFTGEVPEWPVTWDITQTDISVPIQAYGPLRRFAQQTTQIGSAMYRWYTLQPASSQPLAYWPCEDGQYSTVLASGLTSGTPMNITGAPQFAADSSFPCSDAVPVLNGSTWTSTIAAYPGTPQTNGLTFLLDVPASGDTNNAVIATMYTTGTVAQVQLVYTTASGGTVTLNAYSSTGALLVSATSTSILSTGVNGQVSLLQIALSPVTSPAGIAVGFVLWSANSTTLVQTVNGGIGQIATGATLGQITSVSINPGGSAGLVSCSVGHVAVFAVSPVSSYYLSGAAYYSPPFTAYNQENAYDRFLRLCLEQGVTGVTQSATQPESGNKVTMGYQANDTFTDLLQQCFDTDLGIPFEPVDQLGLGARTRLSLYDQNTIYNNARPVLTLDYAQNQLAAAPVPADDDLYSANDVTVSRINGSSARYILESGPNSVQPPPNGIGDYQITPTISLGADSLLPDQAAWRVHLGTVDEPRYPSISVNLTRASVNGQTTLLNEALTADIGDMIQILNPPPSLLGPDTVTGIIQGYTEEMGIWEHTIEFVTVPQSPYAVGVLEDLVLGYADTDGSALHQAYPLGTETTLLIDTLGAATGSPLWTVNSEDCPFDIAVAGERMTVTAIAGASSPQTFTVTRSVNGVVKSQVAGADVRLWQPMILGL